MMESAGSQKGARWDLALPLFAGLPLKLLPRYAAG
jgi:hypothetical protein